LGCTGVKGKGDGKANSHYIDIIELATEQNRADKKIRYIDIYSILLRKNRLIN
jgi:hypothetical protein